MAGMKVIRAMASVLPAIPLSCAVHELDSQFLEEQGWIRRITSEPTRRDERKKGDIADYF
jgi:hypothetical protein